MERIAKKGNIILLPFSFLSAPLAVSIPKTYGFRLRTYGFGTENVKKDTAGTET